MGLEQRIVAQLQALAHREHKIKKIILFGSRAIGDYQKKSDIDLAFVAPEMTDGEWAALTFQIEEELDTLLFLDLIKLDDVSEAFAEEIKETGKTIYPA